MPVGRLVRFIRPVAVAVLVAAGALGACGDGAPDRDPPAGTPTTAPDGTGAGAPAPSWTELAPAPVELSEVDAAAFGGELWVVGGFTADGGVSTAVQVFDPSTGGWRDGPPLPEGVHHTSLVASADALVVAGGYRGRGFGEPTADVLVLDDEDAGWRAGPRLPAARGAGAAAFDGERLVYGGGVGPDGLADEVWALDDPGGAWQEVGRLSVARDHLDAASDGVGRVWFLGGREQSLSRNLGTVDLLTVRGIRELGALPTARGGVAAFHAEAHGACLTGGERPDATFAEVECIDADGRTTVLPPLGVARHGHGAGVIDGVAYVALGGREPGLAVSGSLEALQLSPTR